MPHYTKPLTKVIKGLNKASKLHAQQAKTLTKILKDQKTSYKKVNKARVFQMKAEDVLKQLERHEVECTLRYQRIEERLDDHKVCLSKLDQRLWGLAALIVAVAVAEYLLK